MSLGRPDPAVDGVAAGDVVAAGDGVAAAGDAVRLGSTEIDGRSFGVPDGAMLTAGDADASVDDTGGSVDAALGVEPPHAASSRQMAISSGPTAPSRGLGETGIAAL